MVRKRLHSISAFLIISLYLSGPGSRPTSAAPRTWIGGNNAWVDGGGAANWNPADEPDPDDEAIFNTANVVSLGSDNSILALTMSGGIDLDTNNNDLAVDGLVQLTGSSTNLFIGGAASVVNADNVTVNSGGTVELTGGTLIADEEALFAAGVVAINAGGSLVGHGTVSLADSPLVAATLFNNNGTLTALTRVAVIGQSPPANTLAINGVGLARVDLDGSGETGVVNVNRNQTLDINVTLIDAFNGTANMTQNSTLDIAGAWTLAAGGTINIDNGAVVGIPGVPAGTSTIAGGTLTQTGGALIVLDPDGALIFDAPYVATGGTFTNNGHVTFNATSSITLPSLDFDGGQWTVQNNAQLSINVADYDPGVVNNAFDSVITLNNGDISVLTGDTKFVMNGTLNLISTSGITVWDGQPIDIGNDAAGKAFLNVTGTSISRFTSSVNFYSDAAVNVAAGATLEFNGDVSFHTVSMANNAEFTGSGTLRFNNGIFVPEEVTLNMIGGTVDLDGIDDSGDAILVQAPLVINAATLASFGRENSVGGANIIQIDALSGNATGRLTVNLDDPNAEWTLNPQGVIALFNSVAGSTLLDGSDVNLDGTVSVTGNVSTSARVDIGGTININTAAPEGAFWLAGGNLVELNTIAGGTVNGPGALRAENFRGLKGFGTINAPVSFVGEESELFADGGLLDVNGQITAVGEIHIGAGPSVLNLGNSLALSGTDAGIQMAGGMLTGATITTASIVKSIRGTGTVTNNVTNNGAIEAQGGTLLFTNALSDWDGGTNSGQLRASTGGTLEIQDNGTFAFAGSVNAASGGTVRLNGFDFHFQPAATLSLNNGKLESTNTVFIDGSVVVAAGADSTIDVAFNRFLEFGATSATTLNGTLRLVTNNGNIAAGATFSGTGALNVTEGSGLFAANGAEIDVLIDNEGTFGAGGFLAAGRVDAKDYQQSNTGELQVDIAGTALTQFDRLIVDGAAQLDGLLEIGLLGGFTPALGQMFNVLSATGGVIGTFDSLVQPANMPVGLVFGINYLPTLVQLEVVAAVSGDYNKNGVVDAADYVLWRNTFGNSVTPFSGADGDGDGIVDADDYGVWTAHFGQAAGSAAGTGAGLSTTEVPEPASCVLLALAITAAVQWPLRPARFRKRAASS